ncbi:MAG: glutamate synthase large subunit [Verrucomicrobiota bacterium]
MQKSYDINKYPDAKGMYDPSHEHDNCGVGLVANIHGEKTNAIIKKALGCVCNLVHRGAVDADAKSGDGAGVLTQIPTKIFRPIIEKMGHKLYNDNDLAVGMIFLPGEGEYEQAHCRKITDEIVKKRGLVPIGWRSVPVKPKVMGDTAASTAPLIEQVIILRPEGLNMTDEDFERNLYIARREIEQRSTADHIENFYICSLSSKLISYKGMFTATQLERFFEDLHNPDYETAIAVYHQRFSTNTFPTWGLAQPFRILAHNGEINTIRGNRNWVRARESRLKDSIWGEEADLLIPVTNQNTSDSASLDHTMELLLASGRPLLHAMMMMVPSAFRSEHCIDSDVRSFYEYHELFSEPWDGPAALAVTDGRYVAATLDRNGLRPARYKITQDGMFLLGSEVGVGEMPNEIIIEKGRLAPGEMIAVDTKEGKLLYNNDIKKLLASETPYGEWLDKNVRELSHYFSEEALNKQALKPQQKEEAEIIAEAFAFGHTDEELDLVLKPMFTKGQEPVGSMGDDTPIAALSERPRPLYHYFRQIFAQVTNPAIDPIREKAVMDVMSFCGCKGHWLKEEENHTKQLRLYSPVLTNEEMDKIKALPEDYLQAEIISCVYEIGADHSSGSLEAKITEICELAEKAITHGKSLLILSDKGTDESHAAIPMLLAVGGLHHHLIRVGKRREASILCETADARDVHQYACLIGYGAAAINPYIVWDLAHQVKTSGKGLEECDEQEIINNYRNAINKGLLKIMSKMGISKLSSYHGGQVFEAIGIHKEVIEKFFTGTPSFISGVGIREIAAETIRSHKGGRENAAATKRPHAGYYKFRRDGEAHAVTPALLQPLHRFVGIKGEDKAEKDEDYASFTKAANEHTPIAVRDLLRFKPQDPISLDDVESIEDIRSRFTTAAMSFGALSPEAHETLAIAMNRIGGKSNSGEGGEDKARFTPLPNGDSKNSRIKQVASGRFGVTAEYLASAQEIEIKVAQGAKPGEGGQLPGHKVSALIAKLRHSVPGVMLISPPPHHDIYSIEDLAQLIYDLKQVNPRAKVCVKLVAEAGVGTIAAGVAKAHADVVMVSGHDGGTGASPLSSIKFAGGPWEMGVAETQQILLNNGLRTRVVLRTDGGLRTGRDIVIAGILGAEEFNFGTIALLAVGCVYVRQCHLNNCPVGVATQDDKYRAKYKGTPEMVVRYINAVSKEIREIMASLGIRKFNDLIGHTELLEQISLPDHPKANTLDLANLLYVPDIDDMTPRHHTWERNDKPDDQPLDLLILQEAKSSLQTKTPIHLKYKVKNTIRCVGTMLSGEIAYRYGNEGLPENTIDLELSGSAGQSLGVFLVNGVRIRLFGEANDYVGKGMNGGSIVLLPPKNSHPDFKPSENIICGNTCLYGATGGKLFVYGQAGERFAVRNSGCFSVVEGVGDHGCEYMTNGCIVVLGPTGKNFGAGMSGGLAFVLDQADHFENLFNPEMINIERIETAEDETVLKGLIYEHLEATESIKAKDILDNWSNYKDKFWKVAPASTAATPAPTVITEQAAPAKV